MKTKSIKGELYCSLLDNVFKKLPEVLSHHLDDDLYEVLWNELSREVEREMYTGLDFNLGGIIEGII